MPPPSRGRVVGTPLPFVPSKGSASVPSDVDPIPLPVSLTVPMLWSVSADVADRFEVVICEPRRTWRPCAAPDGEGDEAAARLELPVDETSWPWLLRATLTIPNTPSLSSLTPLAKKRVFVPAPPWPL